MNINFKELAKTALVVGALAATMGANAFTPQQNAKDMLAACQLPGSVFSYQVGVYSRSTADLVRSIVGSQEKMADVYLKSGACEILNSYAAKVTASTTYDEQIKLADQATEDVTDPLSDALQAGYSQEIKNLFGADMGDPAFSNKTVSQPVVETPVSSYGSGPGM